MYNNILPTKNVVLIIVLLFSGTNAFSQKFSDAEIKKNVQPLTSALQRVIQLQPSVYEYDVSKYKHLQLAQGTRYGFMAENVQTVFPELVGQKKVSYMFGKNVYRDASLKTVDEASLIPLLVASIKEQQQQIEELKAAIAELKKRP